MPIIPGSLSSIVGLADVKAHLNIAAADTSHDAELQGFIDAVTPLVENVVGNVSSSTFTNEVYDGGAARIALRHVPVLSVGSVTEFWGPSSSRVLAAALYPNDQTAGDAYWLEKDTGLLRRVYYGQPMAFQGGVGSVVVTYTAGRLSTPPEVRLGSLEAIREFYEQTQQGGRPAFGSSGASMGDVAVPRAPFALSYRVLEMLQPKRTNWGIG